MAVLAVRICMILVLYCTLSILFTGTLVVGPSDSTLPSGFDSPAAHMVYEGRVTSGPMRVILDSLAFVARPLLRWYGSTLLPQTNGTLSLPAGLLSKPVRVYRDAHGLVHIYAQSQKDLVTAQAYVHAQDRLFQMQLNRMMALGRLSSVFGEVALPADQFSRTVGFYRHGKQDWKDAAEHVRPLMQAYCDGINAYLQRAREGQVPLPLELKLFGGIVPDDWQPDHLMAFARIMSFQMSEGWNSEIVRQLLIEAVGPEAAMEFDTADVPHNAQVHTAGEFNPKDAEATRSAHLPPFFDQKRGWGSNAWSVHGSRTATGKPLLANDPHLVLNTPSIWYYVHLNAPADEANGWPAYHAAGVSLPGLPFIMIGHNDRIAWGITVSLADYEDLFVETLNEDGDKYKHDGEWKDVMEVQELIEVKGQDKPTPYTVRLTHHGPLISDMLGYSLSNVSLCAGALQHPVAVEGMHKVNLAQNWDQFAGGVSKMHSLPLNMLYADADGNIGYIASGDIPLRKDGDGSVPADGTGSHDWIGTAPFEEQPWTFNPKSGVVISANQKIVQKDYKHEKMIGRNHMNGYRALRIKELLDAAPKEEVTQDMFARMQVDVKSIPGEEFRDLAAKLLDPSKEEDEEVQLALRMIAGWDAYMHCSSVPASVYSVAKHFMLRVLLDGPLSREVADVVMGKGVSTVLKPTTEYYGHDVVNLLAALKRGNDSFFVRSAGGADVVMRKGLKHAIEWLRREFGPSTAAWVWGRLHRTDMPHKLEKVEPLDRIFNNLAGCIGGDTDTVQQTAALPASSLEKAHHNAAWAPSYRQLVDVSDMSKTRIIYSPGQSGQLGSPHYNDLTPIYANGDYLVPAWHEADVKDQCDAVLVME